MKKSSAPALEAPALRQRAERQLREGQQRPEPAQTEGEARALVHELQVHQIELELQHEELHRAQVEAQLAADKYVELFDFAPVGSFVLDAQGLIREVNLAGAALLGRDRQRVANQPFEPYLAPDGRPAFRELFLNVLTGAGRHSCETQLLQQGHGPCDVRIDATLAVDASGLGHGCRLAVTDITGRKRNEAQLRQLNAELEQRVAARTAELQGANDTLRGARIAALNLTEDAVQARRQAEQSRDELRREVLARQLAEEELSRVNRTLRALSNSDRALMNAQQEQDFLDAVCQNIVNDCGHAMVWIGYAEDDAARTIRPVASAGFEAGYLETLQLTWADTERGRGPTGTAIRTGQLSLCHNLLTDPQFAPWRAEAVRRGYASSLVLPLLDNGRAFGAITLYARQPAAFTDAEVQLLIELAGELARGVLTLRLRTAHQRAEEALHASEERFRNMFEKHHAVELLIDPETGTIVDANAAATRFYGYTREQLCTQRIQDINQLPPAAVAAERQKAAAEQRSYFVFPHRLANGTVRWVEVYSTPVETHGRPLLYSIIHDITARKEAEAALFESNQRLRAVMTAVPVGISFSEDATCQRITGNPAALAQFAVEGEEHLSAPDAAAPGRQVQFFHDGERLAAHELPLQRAVAENAVIAPMVLEIRMPDGRRWFAEASGAPVHDEQGAVIAGLTVTVDITKRREAEEALHASETQFRLLFDSNPNPMWVFDEQTLRFLAVNDAALRHYGYDREEFLALTVLDIRPPEERAQVPAVIASQAGARETRIGAFRHLKKDGTLIDVEIVVSSIPFNGRPSRLVMINDITERLRSERTVRMQAAALDATVNSILITDAQGRVQWVNPAFTALTGYTPGEICGQTPRLLKSGRQPASFYEHLWRTILAGQPWQGEIINRHKDGKSYPEQMTITPFRAGAGGAITHFIAIKENIAARRQAEDAIVQLNAELEGRVLERTASLVAANARMRQEYAQRKEAQTALEEQMRIVEAFLAHSLTPLVFLDRQFNFVRVNAAFARACGQPIAAFPGRNYFECYPHAEHARIFAEVVQTGKPHTASAQPFSFQAQPLAGDSYWDWTLVPLCDAAGTVEHLVFSLEDVTERKRTENQVQLFQQDLRALTASLLLTEERERKKLALVLHDSIGQMMALIRIKLAALERRLQAKDTYADATALKLLAEDTIRQVRSLTTELSPPILYQAGLASALQDVGAHLQEEFGVRFQLDGDGCPEQLDETLRILLYQSARELLFNVGKHARAKHVYLTFAPQGDKLQLIVKDDGVGFAPGAVGEQTRAAKSFGLFSIRERMFHVGGTMGIVSAPGQGTTITLSVPLQLSVQQKG